MTPLGPAGIVAIAPGWLGDAVMAIPALRALESSASLTVLAHARVAPLLDLAFPGRVVRFAPRAVSLSAMRQSRSLPPDGAAMAVIFPRSFSSALRAVFIGARVRVGVASEARGVLLTRSIRLPWPERSRHLADEYALLAEAAGAGTPRAFPHLAISPEARAAAWRLLESRAVANGTPLAIVAPGAAFGSAKQWFSARFASLCAAIDAAGARAVLVGAASEKPVASRVAREAERLGARAPLDLTGQTDIGALCGVLSIARVVAANDSGPMHLAAAVGTPVVALFGSTNPDWTRPLGEGHDVLRYPTPCAPCYRRVCPIGRICFDGIDVERVRRAVIARLQ
ncbi:MAG: lipopolysaccharide heptosyltransferase II [bacterium]